MKTKNITDLLSLLPIALITLCFVTEDNLYNKTKNLCIGQILYLFLFSSLYIMLLFLKIKKWVALFISMILWILLVIFRKSLE